MRWILGAVFLVVLLAEWGSHSLTFSHTMGGDGSTVHSTGYGHDDPCKTLVHSPDGKQQNPPSPRHNVSPFAGFLFADLDPQLSVHQAKPPLSDRERIDPLSRPLNPPFHPPEFS
jgi:hypothetical protein